MRVGVVGGEGFVGSAFMRYLSEVGIKAVAITRANYPELCGSSFDVLINAGGNSKKWLAEDDRQGDFDLTVRSTLAIVLELRAEIYVHLSSIDVYNDVSDPTCNFEEVSIVPERLSNYGFGKYLAELVVRKYARNWLILRLGGMVGQGLKKNSIYDLLNGIPLRVHPESAYQYLNTKDIAQLAWALIERERMYEVFNLCGDNVIQLREVQQWLGVPSIDNGMKREHYEINVSKLKKILPLPKTRSVVKGFVNSWLSLKSRSE
jgi:nucleoside-diphosphate-sugar epimerase